MAEKSESLKPISDLLRSDPPPKRNQEIDAKLSEANSADPQNSAEKTPKPSFKDFSNSLQPEWTFETFIVSSSTRLAHAVTLTAVEKFTKEEKPEDSCFIYIHSDTGLGKSHLLHATAHFIKTKTGLRVLFLNGEDLFAYLGGGSSSDNALSQSESFTKKISHYDVLIIDGIRFLNRSNIIQDAFNKVVDSFLEEKKHIFLSGEVKPSSIEKLSDRTRSRLAQASHNLIDPPDEELKLKFLQFKTEAGGLQISPNLLKAIAIGTRPDLRELQARVDELLRALTQSAESDTKFSSSYDELEDDSDSEESQTSNFEVTAIMKVSASHFGKKVSELKSGKRDKSIVKARQVAMYLCRMHSERSFDEIGKAFGNRNHATVIYAVNKITDLIEDDNPIKSDLKIILKNLKSEH